MKKHYFIYTLLFAYSCSAFAVKPTLKHNQPNHKVQVDASSRDDEFNENSDGDVEVPKKPTLLESWRKVASLKWRSLNRDDAWNIGKTVTLAGVGCYLFSHFAKGTNGPNNPNLDFNPDNPFGGDPGQLPQQPLHSPFGIITPEELQQQREALEAFEQQQQQQEEGRRALEVLEEQLREQQQEEVLELLRQVQRLQQQREAQQQQAALQRQQEEGRQALEALQGQLREREAQRLVQQQQALQEQAERNRLERERVERLERNRLERDQAQAEWRRQFDERNRQAQQLQQQREEQQNRLQEALEEGRQLREEHLQQVQQRIQQREALQRQREERQNEFVQWQEEYERDLAEAIRQSQLMEDERINNASIIVIEPAAEVLVPEVVVDPAQAVDCTVCLETKKMADCYTMTCCNVTFCKECLIQQLTAGLDTNSSAEVKCPTQNCLIKIEQPVMEAITTNNKDVLNRYLDITFNEWLIAQGAKQCRTVDCPFKFLPTEIPASIVCSACHERYCNQCLFNHDVDNVTCDQAARDRDPILGNQANEEWIAANTKNCPNCNHGIQKNEGCNHMTCGQCRHEFCWTCLAAYRTTRCNYDSCAVLNIQTGVNF